MSKTADLTIIENAAGILKLRHDRVLLRQGVNGMDPLPGTSDRSLVEAILLAAARVLDEIHAEAQS